MPGSCATRQCVAIWLPGRCRGRGVGTLVCVADTDVEVPRRATGVAKQLSTPSRITAFTFGIAGLGAGAVAVFVTHLEAGPVALLAVGLIFMIFGLAGTLPTRLKVGDNEAAWELERQAVETFVRASCRSHSGGEST